MTTILATLAFLAVFARVMRKRVHGPMIPISNARALFRWSEKFDQEFPVDSEARLALQARGAAAKRRLMAHLRNRPQPASVPDALAFGVHRIGDGPLQPLRLNVVPLASIQPTAKAEVPVIVRRPKLSLAR